MILNLTIDKLYNLYSRVLLHLVYNYNLYNFSALSGPVQGDWLQVLGGVPYQEAQPEITM